MISGSHSGCRLDGGWGALGTSAGAGRAEGERREGRLEEPEWAQRLAALLRAMAGRLKAASQV